MQCGDEAGETRRDETTVLYTVVVKARMADFAGLLLLLLTVCGAERFE